MRDRTELAHFDEEQEVQHHALALAGFDEAGRGPLCGPVAAGGVVLPVDFFCPLIDDSKKLSAAGRTAAEFAIKKQARAWAVSFVAPADIDHINILEASRLGMENCLGALCRKTSVDFIITDYMKLHTPIPVLAIPHGDATSETVAAASILAKTARDRYMVELAARYPEYGFERHKGYPTRSHLEVLARLGLIRGLYRLSYAPVRRILAERGYNGKVPPWQPDW